MNEQTIERIFIFGARFGVIQTLSELDMLEEKMLIPKAELKYGKKNIDSWRQRRWIKFYPTGNEKRGKFYVRRSECEKAKLMFGLSNVMPQNIIDEHIHPLKTN